MIAAEMAPEIAPAQPITKPSEPVTPSPQEIPLPHSIEEYFFKEIQEEAYRLWQANGHTAEACWAEAKRLVTKRGFQPKLVATVHVVEETREHPSE